MADEVKLVIDIKEQVGSRPNLPAQPSATSPISATPPLPEIAPSVAPESSGTLSKAEQIKADWDRWKQAQKVSSDAATKIASDEEEPLPRSSPKVASDEAASIPRSSVPTAEKLDPYTHPEHIFSSPEKNSKGSTNSTLSMTPRHSPASDQESEKFDPETITKSISDDAATEAAGGATEAAGGIAAETAGTGAIEAAGVALAPETGGLSLLVAGAAAAGGALGAMTPKIEETIGKFANLTRRMDDLAESIAGISPEVALAQAQGDVRKTLALYDREQKLGPQAGEFTTAQNNVEVLLQKIETEIGRGVMPTITELINLVGGFLELAREILTVVNDIKDLIPKPVKDAIGGVVEGLLAGPLGPLIPLLKYFQNKAAKEAEAETNELIKQLHDFIDPAKFLDSVPANLMKPGSRRKPARIIPPRR